MALYYAFLYPTFQLMCITSMVFIKSIFFLLFHHFVVTSCNAVIGHHYTPHHTLLSDKAALLQLKKAITYDPNSTLDNWKEATDVCNFTCVACNTRHHRVTELLLHDLKLVGQLSPFISNLTGLRYLELVGNHFYGTLPPEISFLRRLHHLRIEGNDFGGSIPDSLVLPSQLTVVTLLQNNFSGDVPLALFSNCSVLRVLDISNNFLSGNIPREIGNCPNLWTLNLYNNQFTGEIPISLTNTSLVNLDVEFNHLSGELPVKLVKNLPDLLYLHLSNNDMVSHDGNTNLDPFFTALANCTSLEELELASMGLRGTLPSSIGGLGVNFTNLLLQENQLFGSVPSSIGNISKLVVLNLTSNLMNGTIPANISKLLHLEQLFLSHNFFTNTIPDALGHLPQLGLLDLSHNSFFGYIPSSLGNLARLNYLFLNNNHLSGAIPSAIGRCAELYRLDLSFNRLNGTIPSELSGLSDIRIFINLSHNHLEGSIPIELSKLEDVQEMDLSSNNLNGSIFPQISSCIALTLINFSHNALEGSLPDSIGDLKNLESFDVSDNHLSGKIPVSLNKTQTLEYLNLSYNDFQGKVPSGGIFEILSNNSFLGNKHLCGKNAPKHKCPRTKHLFSSHLFIVAFVIAIFISTSLSIVCFVIALRRVKALLSSHKVVEKQTQPELLQNFPRVTHRDLSDATNGFDDQRLIGTGSYGRVYKGVLPDGTTIALKVLHLQSGNSTKSFNRECQVLRRIRHRNLIRIITACSLPDFKAIVLPYMANGSLDSRLYPHSLQTGLGSGSSDLSLIQRINICSDIAEGMAYLHHYSPVRVIHCDLKPSNVLLNDDMTALVSDFGIARLVIAGGGNAAGVENMGNSTTNILCGSIGYIAPEYGFGSKTSTKGDVYSFGILVLEMMTTKRPIDDMFVGGLSLQSWVRSHYHGRSDKVVDTTLLRITRDESPEVRRMWNVALGEMLELGILCTQESPSTRPTMMDAADDLDRLKRYLGGDTTATFASSLGISSSTLDDD